jgi:hypothetical protein
VRNKGHPRLITDATYGAVSSEEQDEQCSRSLHKALVLPTIFFECFLHNKR